MMATTTTSPSSKQQHHYQQQGRKRILEPGTNHRDSRHREDDEKKHLLKRHRHPNYSGLDDADDDDFDAASTITDHHPPRQSSSPSSSRIMKHLSAPFTATSSTATATNDDDNNNTNNGTETENTNHKRQQQRPAWVPTKEAFPWSSTTATYGHCTNVSARYTKICRIGEGTYGVVYLAHDKITNEQVALKRCLPHHEASDGFPITTLREIAILKELASAGGEMHGIITLRDVTVSSSRSGVFLVFEYAQHDLASLIDNYYTQHNCSPFTHSEVKRLMLQLLEALRFLHSNYILHRDLKLSNLLYNHRGELKVADFGLARRVGGEYIVVGGNYVGGGNRSHDRTTDGSKGSTAVSMDPPPAHPPPPCCLTPKVVSLWYRPPELLLGAEQYDSAVDLWGSGCVMGELLRGKPIMDGKNEMDQLQKMFEFLGPPNSDDWPGLMELPLLKRGEIEIPKRWHNNNMGKKNADRHLLDIFRDWRDPPGIKLLMGLLKYNPAVRLTADEALASAYFLSLPAPTPLRLMPTFPTKHNT